MGGKATQGIRKMYHVMREEERDKQTDTYTDRQRENETGRDRQTD